MEVSVVAAVLRAHQKGTYRRVTNSVGYSFRPECSCEHWPWTEEHVAEQIVRANG